MKFTAMAQLDDIKTRADRWRAGRGQGRRTTQGFSAQRGDLAELPVGLLQTLLDERKALREALEHILPLGHDGEAVVYAALALGEDE